MNEYGFTQGLARNASESAYPNLWRGLVGLWCPSAGQQGQKLIDFRNLNSAVFSGPPSWTPGRNGTALIFNGTSNYLTIAKTAWLDITTSLSISVWIKSNSGNTGPIITRNLGGYGVYMDAGGIGFGKVGTDDLATAAITAGLWYHVTAVHYSSVSSIYLNGELAAGPASRSDFSSLTDAILVGTYLHTGGFWFNGSIGDIGIYNRALSIAEIRQLYAGSSPLVRRIDGAVFRASSSVSAIFRNRTGSRYRIAA